MSLITEPKIEMAESVTWPGYSALADGHVYTHWGITGNSVARTRRRLRDPSFCKRLPERFNLESGYFDVNLWGNGRSITKRVHRVVLDAFEGSLPKGLLSRHIDGNYLNNRRNNLKYGTFYENSRDSRIHGTHAVGVKTNSNKLTEDQVKDIRAVPNYWEVTVDLAVKYNVHQTCISAIRTYTKLGEHLKA